MSLLRSLSDGLRSLFSGKEALRAVPCCAKLRLVFEVDRYDGQTGKPTV
jgi:hypothetical protein